MAELETKIQNTLDESRILILGTQVLIGFQYRSAFESGFDKLSPTAQQLELAGLGLLTVTLALLMSPIPFHHLREDGESSPRLNGFGSAVMGLALLPFALAMGAGLYIVLEKFDVLAAAVVSSITVLVALTFWYGLGIWGRLRSRRAMSDQAGEKQGGPKKPGDLSNKIKHVLTEARMVLPGAQAMLGFQTIIMLGQGFDALPNSSKYLHLASLLMTALATILLMAPAAYHRIAEHGEESESFVRFTCRFVLASLVPLALGITGDLAVVVRKVTGSLTAGVAGALLGLIFMYGLWFGYTVLLRRRAEPGSASADEQHSAPASQN